VTLDRFDNRLANLWAYVLAALRRAGVALPAGLAAPADELPDGHTFLHQLAGALAAQHPPVTLVLDDIHVLTNPAALDQLAYVLRHASRGAHLVVASRMDPLLPLHRYRLTGELTEIRGGDLAFTVPEAGLLLAQHGVTCSAGALRSLTSRTEGWAAGLRLAAMSIARQPDPEQFIKDFSAEDSAITGYLVDEVLNAQPAHTRDLLLKTSILGRVSDSLACELTGNQQLAGVIPALAQANTFIRPLGHGWYRFHWLFAEVLRLKLRRESPQQVPLLQRRAARWLQGNGTVAEAADQAAAASDWQLAARIAVDELTVGELADPLAGETLADVFRHMPVVPAASDPEAWIVAAAMALRDQRYDAAGGQLRCAETSLARRGAGAEPRSQLAAALLGFALARRTGDLAAAHHAASRAEALLGGMPEDTLMRHPGVRARVLADRGAAELWAGRMEAAARLLTEAAVTARHTPEWAGFVGQHALAEAARGRLGLAAELAAAAVTPPGGRPAGSPGAAAQVALAWASVEHNQLSNCTSELARAEDALRARPDKLVSTVAALIAARQRLAGRNPGVAAAIVRRARGGWSPPAWLERKLAVTESQACAAAGDTEAALAAAGRVEPPGGFERAVALARAQLAAGDQEAASQALARAPAESDGEVPGCIRLEARLVEAELGYSRNDPDRGRRSLEQALRMAYREQLRLPVILQRAWIHPVLRHDPGLAAAFRRLFDPVLAVSGRGDAGAGPAIEARPIVVDQLSGKEQEVLRYAAKMLSTAEIAGEMYLSVNTVKSHFKSIFRKLGASHRGEAVRRAQQLGLLLPAAHSPLRREAASGLRRHS
jgi:LuxR family maltose regulon positive regulatory protein